MKVDPNNLTDLEKALLDALGWTPLILNLDGCRGDVLDSDWLQPNSQIREQVDQCLDDAIEDPDQWNEATGKLPWLQDPDSWAQGESASKRVLERLKAAKAELIGALSYPHDPDEACDGSVRHLYAKGTHDAREAVLLDLNLDRQRWCKDESKVDWSVLQRIVLGPTAELIFVAGLPQSIEPKD